MSSLDLFVGWLHEKEPDAHMWDWDPCLKPNTDGGFSVRDSETPFPRALRYKDLQTLRPY